MHRGPDIEMLRISREREIAVLRAANFLEAENRTKMPILASRTLVLLTAVASLGSMLFGYDTGVISGALPYIRDDVLQRFAGDSAR